MADTPTPNYQFGLAEASDLMSDPGPYITDNFQKIYDAAAPTTVTYPGPLPATAEVGKRVYMNNGPTSDLTSMYVCVASNATWGAWWKPVQAAISPWRSIPATAFLNTDFQQHPTIPAQIALDSMGRLYWRGAVQVKVGFTIPNYTTFSIFNTMPDGIRPPNYGNYNVTIDPVNLASPASTLAFKGGRVYIRPDGGTLWRVFGVDTTPKTTDIWLGDIKYAAGRNDYMNN